MSVNAIEREDVVKLIDNVTSRSGSTSNRTLSLLSAAFNITIDHALIDMNPAARLKPRHKAIARDRVLSTAELPVVWRAMIPHGYVSSTIMRLMFLTAQRGGEIRQMRWNDIDFNSSWWTVPGEIAQNGRAHRVPLCHRARALIEAQEPNGQFVFSLHRGKSSMAKATYDRHMQRVAAIHHIA